MDDMAGALLCGWLDKYCPWVGVGVGKGKDKESDSPDGGKHFV